MSADKACKLRNNPNSFNPNNPSYPSTGRHRNTPRITPPWEIRRRLVAKAEEETDPRFGHKPDERPIEEHIRFGVINLDKPAGPSSHEVTAWVKRLLSLEHAGHGGTLEAQV